MYFVYAIKSRDRNYVYVGLTDNLDRRIQQHNAGHESTTKPYRPFEVVYTEEVSNRAAARSREKFLKSGSGKEFIKSQIVEQ